MQGNDSSNTPALTSTASTNFPYLMKTI